MSRNNVLSRIDATSQFARKFHEFFIVHKHTDMTTYISIVTPENHMSTSCLSSMLRLQHTPYAGSLMFDISQSVRESITKAKKLENLRRVVILHESCGVSSDFVTTPHPHPIVCAGYGQSAIDWERMSKTFPHDTSESCASAGSVYNFNLDRAESEGTDYLKIDECECKIISCSPDALWNLETSFDTDTYTVRTPCHVYIPATTLHNVEFCFVGSFIDKYGSKESST